MSQPTALCRNKVQAELKKEIELCHDTAKECVKKTIATLLTLVATLIKANGSGTFSQQSLLCRNIKE